MKLSKVLAALYRYYLSVGNLHNANLVQTLINGGKNDEVVALAEGDPGDGGGEPDEGPQDPPIIPPNTGPDDPPDGGGN